MALQKKGSEVPLIGGIDTKTDSKQVKLGKLLDAQNIVYRNPGKINKRDGFQSISQDVIDTGVNIVDGQALMTYNNELLAFDKDNIYSRVESSDGWKDKGDFQSLYVQSNSVTNGQANDTQNSNALHPGGLQAYAFIRKIGATTSFTYEIIDTETGQIVVGPKTVSGTANAINTRVIAFGDQFIFYYYDTATTAIYSARLSVQNPTNTLVFSQLTPVVANRTSVSPTYPAYDVAAISTNAGTFIYLSFTALEAGNYYLTSNRYDSAISTTPSYTVSVLLGTTNAPTYICLYHAQDYDGLGIAYVTVNGTNVVNTRYSVAFTSSGTTSYVVGAGVTLNRVVAVMEGGEAGNFTKGTTHLWVDYLVTATGRNWINYATRSGASSFATQFSKQQVIIAGGPIIYNSRGYVIALGSPNLTSATNLKTYFLLNNRGDAISRSLYQTAGPITSETYGLWKCQWVPKAPQLDSTKFFCGLRNTLAYASIAGQDVIGITSLQFDFFNPEYSYTNSNIANSLYVGGGMLYQYDGQNLVEDSFNWRPQINSMTFTNGSANNYQYVAVWEWIDNAGAVHRSSPSDPYKVTLIFPISPTNIISDIQLFPLSLTYKTPENARTVPQCVLYRTKANSSTYYRLPTTVANNNDTTALWITPVNDQVTDAQLDSYPILYTDALGSGETRNSPPPPIGALTVYRNRLWALDSTNPLVINYSKLVNFATPVDWSTNQVINVDPSGGPVTGLVSMDDKLIIFKQNSIRFISGQGPNAKGENEDYGSTTLITTDAGCINQRSIVSSPEGIMFKSSKGIYFLNRGLQVSYIGAPVEKWNSNFVTSGLLQANNNQIRLTLDNNLILVYDYYVDNWATFTNLGAVDSTIWNDRHAFIRSNGRVSIETPGTWQDDGVSYPMSVTTGWFAFGGIQGYSRLWKMTLLGAFKSKHKLGIELYYDYNDAYSQTITVIPIEQGTYGIAATTNLNDNDTYGVETPYGGKYSIYQYEVRPERQKCMSIKMKISDSALSVPLEEGYELSNIRLSYGVIGGANRVSGRETFGN